MAILSRDQENRVLMHVGDLAIRDDSNPVLVTELVAWIDEKLRALPQEARATAYITVRKWEDDDGEIELYYKRPETPAEKTERETKHAEYVRYSEQRDREYYLRLKERFEVRT